MGTLHGGILCDIADAAMGMAYASTLGEGETCTTLELTINFLKPVWQARLQAIGRVVTHRRTMGLVDATFSTPRRRWALVPPARVGRAARGQRPWSLTGRS